MKKQEKIFFVLAIVATFITTGLFLPILAGAGSLNPGAPPGPTMKTLDEIPPTWSQKLQCDGTACPRFELVLDGYAVLDKETGLVWEQSPGTGAGNWYVAITTCYNKAVGGRKGFRLPTIEELLSLFDPQATSGPYLPNGHPFSDVQPSAYWSATTHAGSLSGPDARRVNFYFSGGMGVSPKNYDGYVWCVRGGAGHDAY